MAVSPGWLPHQGRVHGVSVGSVVQLPVWPSWPSTCRTPSPRWWWCGVEGGVGTSSLAEASDGRGGDAGHAWPNPATGNPWGVVLVARSTARGLHAAMNAARQHAAGRVPQGLLLLGLVVVADAPGKMPRRLANHLQVVSGAVPNLWELSWCEPWRHRGTDEHLDCPPDLGDLVAGVERALQLSDPPFMTPPRPVYA